MGVYFCFLCFLSYLHSRDKEMPMTRVNFFMFICTINETWAFYRVTCNHPKKVSKKRVVTAFAHWPWQSTSSDH